MAVATAVQRWDRFRSSIVIRHSGTHRGRSFTDTHPFVRSHAGRDWIFAHNGDLGRNLDVTLPLDETLGFKPVGHTDSEHALCWLMGQVQSHGARSFADVGWETIRGWLQKLNELGTLNMVWSDGLHVLAYHDKNGFNELHHLRRLPPPSSTKLESDLLETSIDVNQALHRDFRYIPGATTLETSPFDVFQERRGVCQDFANLFICLARLLGVPARIRPGQRLPRRSRPHPGRGRA